MGTFVQEMLILVTDMLIQLSKVVQAVVIHETDRLILFLLFYLCHNTMENVV